MSQSRNCSNRFDATGGISGPSPQITASAPQARIVPQKKVTGPVQLGCILGPVPPKILLLPPQA